MVLGVKKLKIVLSYSHCSLLRSSFFVTLSSPATHFCFTNYHRFIMSFCSVKDNRRNIPRTGTTAFRASVSRWNYKYHSRKPSNERQGKDGRDRERASTVDAFDAREISEGAFTHIGAVFTCVCVLPSPVKSLCQGVKPKDCEKVVKEVPSIK